MFCLHLPKSALGYNQKPYSFFGTIRFLHSDASFKTYHYFLSHVRAILGDKVGAIELKVGEGFNIGSDDEKAMTKALDMCFRESERYLCIKHMKDNLNPFLIQKEQIHEKSRRKIVNEIFGPVAL